MHRRTMENLYAQLRLELRNGLLSERRFIDQAHRMGIDPARIERCIEKYENEWRQEWAWR